MSIEPEVKLFLFFRAKASERERLFRDNAMGLQRSSRGTLSSDGLLRNRRDNIHSLLSPTFFLSNTSIYIAECGLRLSFLFSLFLISCAREEAFEHEDV